MERRLCPACKNHALIKKENTFSCAICGYIYNSEIFQNDIKEIKRLTKEEETIFEINEAAQFFFQKALKKNKKAQNYLKKRDCYNQKDLQVFGFGYDNGMLKQYLESLGYTEHQLYYCGLIKYETDFFIERITFPIRDSLGRILGFGARNLDGDDVKYINTQETPIFHKKTIFFGIDKINFKKPIMLCEGYFDCITLQKKGFNAIATLGTALTIEHAILLKEIGQDIYLIYDNDKAGKKATINNMYLLQSVGINCKWVELNNCKDPDEFLTKNSDDELKNNIINAKTRKDAVLCNVDISSMYEIVNYLT